MARRRLRYWIRCKRRAERRWISPPEGAATLESTVKIRVHCHVSETVTYEDHPSLRAAARSIRARILHRHCETLP